MESDIVKKCCWSTKRYSGYVLLFGGRRAPFLLPYDSKRGDTRRIRAASLPRLCEGEEEENVKATYAGKSCMPRRYMSGDTGDAVS